MSLCVLVDSQLESLPLEHLEVFSQIPSRSKDFSLFQLGKKYQESSTSNNPQNRTEDMKYIAYDFKEEGDNLKKVVQSLSLKNMKVSGISSGERVASVGEWQKSVQESQSVMFYAHQPLLEVLPPSALLQWLGQSTVQQFLILDKLNNKKHLIDKKKWAPAGDRPVTLPLHDQTIRTVQLLNFLGPRQVAITRWSVDIQQTLQQLH